LEADLELIDADLATPEPFDTETRRGVVWPPPF